MVIQRKAKTIFIDTIDGWNSSIATMDRNSTDAVIIKSNTKIRHYSENADEMVDKYDILTEEFKEKVEEIKKNYFIVGENTIVNFIISRNNLLSEKRTKLMLEIVLRLVDSYTFNNISESLAEFTRECISQLDNMITENGFEKY